MAGSLERLDPPRPFGRMTLLAELGRGGMATVMLAAVGQGALLRPAAVKLLSEDVPDHDYRTRFLDEARVLVRLHHNNLVDVREAGEIDHQLYIAMELVEGRDLADLWHACAERGRAVPVALAVHIVREVLRGLHYAHTAPGLELVHRDVTPSNILIDWAGAVRLADFGLATSSIRVARTVPGIVFGKVGYMSPEQARRQPVDARTDIYACGVVLWELLTGRMYREPGCDTTTVASAEAVPPSRWTGRVDDELDGIVIRAIAPDASARYATAEAFQDALSSWLARHAPGTEQDQVAAFMIEVFGDVARAERAEIERLLQRVAGPGRTVIMDGMAAPGARSAAEPEPEPSSPWGAATEEDELLTEGTVLDERYQVLSRLGQGGMGTVYLGEHLAVGRSVAIKVLTRALSANPDVARRFRAEARSASAAGHPNIIEVFDAGTLPDGRLYLVMEFLAGRSLLEELQDGGPLEPARACRMLRDVARALRAAHRVGVVHRDLKPENVMLARKGEELVIKVLDFGISAQHDGTERMTQVGQALGTCEYMAPEQARGETPTPSIDIYALGVLAFELLTGTPPFEGGSPFELLARKFNEPAPSLASALPGAPGRLVALVDACLQRDPAGRPASMDEVIAELDAILRELPRDSGPARTGLGVAQAGVGTDDGASERAVPASPEAPLDTVPAGRRAPWLALGVGGLLLAATVAFFVRSRDEGAPEASPAAGDSAAAAPADGVAAAAAGGAAPVDGAASARGVTSVAGAPSPAPAARDLSAGSSDRSGAPGAAGASAAPEDPPSPSAQPQSSGARAPGPGAKKRGGKASSPADTPACARTRKDAEQAYADHRWASVLRHTKKRSCFADRGRRRLMRVRALKELGRFDECLDEPAGGSSEIAKIQRFCRSRLERE